jgi:hypothetical protein
MEAGRQDAAEKKAEDVLVIPKLGEGRCYLVEEGAQKRSFEIFEEVIANGATGICFTRDYPERISEKYKLKDVPIIWLCYSLGEFRMNPRRLGLLGREIIAFMNKYRNSAVLLDGIEYLVTNNDFEAVLKTLHSICEATVEHSSLLIVSVDPETQSKKELALIERNMEVIA